jgi:hypothetical protein
MDQFTDIFDFAGGVANLGQYKMPPKDALDIFQLAEFQFQAAAPAVSVSRRRAVSPYRRGTRPERRSSRHGSE